MPRKSRSIHVVAVSDFLFNVADHDGWRIRLRELRLSRDRAELERLAEGKDAASQPQDNVDRLADLLDEVGARDAALGLRRKAQQRNPADFYLNLNLGFALYLFANFDCRVCFASNRECHKGPFPIAL